MAKYQRWDLWYAHVSYTDAPDKEKARPILITSSGEAFLVALYITSASPRPGYPDYIILDWKDAGLTMPSTIRFDRTLKIFPSDLIHKIGRLQQNDIIKVGLHMAKMK
jgi:hypothetical protein